MEAVINGNAMIIYHYCSGESFLGIIRSKKLWLSGIMNMSDYSEVLLARTIINEELHRLASRFDESIIESFVQNFQANEFRPYICCFSSAQDKLSQWRGYADDGRGFAIGFDSNILCQSTAMPSMARDQDSILTLNRVEYDADKARLAIHNYVQGALLALQMDREPPAKNWDELSDEQRHARLTAACCRNASSLLRGYQVIVKNPAFVEESEYRLVHMPFWLADRDTKLTTDIPFSVSSPQYRISKDRLCTYFEFDFGSLIEHGVIREVWLGPKNQTINMEIEAFLGDSGLSFKFVEVRRSNATYR